MILVPSALLISRGLWRAWWDVACRAAVGVCLASSLCPFKVLSFRRRSLDWWWTSAWRVLPVSNHPSPFLLRCGFSGVGWVFRVVCYFDLEDVFCGVGVSGFAEGEASKCGGVRRCSGGCLLGGACVSCLRVFYCNGRDN